MEYNMAKGSGMQSGLSDFSTPVSRAADELIGDRGKLGTTTSDFFQSAYDSLGVPTERTFDNTKEANDSFIQRVLNKSDLYRRDEEAGMDNGGLGDAVKRALLGGASYLAQGLGNLPIQDMRIRSSFYGNKLLNSNLPTGYDFSQYPQAIEGSEKYTEADKNIAELIEAYRKQQEDKARAERISSPIETQQLQ